MIVNITEALVINGGLIFLYLLIPGLALRPLLQARSPAERLLWPITLGISSQALLGFAWGHIMRNPGYGPTCTYAVLWLGTGLILRRCAAPHARQATRSEWAWPILLVLAAMSIRLVHPLQINHLGQSDAYAHLTFIKDLLVTGRLRNPAYPSGYHWIMVMPCQVFSFDPYLVARYGGAFFGGWLVLGIYAVGERISGSWCGRTSAFLAGCCPAFLLLMKTGVGCFANQMGLALLPPLVLLLHDQTQTTKPTRPLRLLPLAVTAAGLASCVPLMLLEVILLMGLERLFFLLKKGWSSFCRSTPPMILALAPAILLVIIHASEFGPKAQSTSLHFMTGQSVKIASQPKPQPDKEPAPDHGSKTTTPRRVSRPQALALLITDFLSVKHVGLPHIAFNLAFILIALTLLLMLGADWRGWPPAQAMRFVMLLGLLTVTQTALGVLEFTTYQRSGWILMICCAWLGGWIITECRQRLPLAALTRVALISAAILCLAVAFRHPPAHRSSMSSAENTLIKLSRTLGYRALRLNAMPSPWHLASPTVKKINPRLTATTPLTLVTRSTSGTGGGYWEVADAVCPPYACPSPIHVARETDLPHRFPTREVLVFIDDPTAIPPSSLGVNAIIDPARARSFSRHFQKLYKANDLLTALVQTSRTPPEVTPFKKATLYRITIDPSTNHEKPSR
jgi:hypothetical protein